MFEEADFILLEGNGDTAAKLQKSTGNLQVETLQKSLELSEVFEKRGNVYIMMTEVDVLI